MTDCPRAGWRRLSRPPAAPRGDKAGGPGGRPRARAPTAPLHRRHEEPPGGEYGQAGPRAPHLGARPICIAPHVGVSIPHVTPHLRAGPQTHRPAPRGQTPLACPHVSGCRSARVHTGSTCSPPLSLGPWGTAPQHHPPEGSVPTGRSPQGPPHPSCVQVGGPQSSAPGLSPLGGVEEIPRDPRQCPPCGGGAGPTGDPSPLCPCHTSIPAPRGTQLHREQVNTRPSAGREVVPPRQAGSACPWGAAGCAGCRAAPTGSAAPTDLAQGAAGV